MKSNTLPPTNDFPDLSASDLQNISGQQPPPIFVVGMHNSGTSILTEVLHKNGVFFSANMRHYESYFFSSFINDRIIMGGGGKWAELPIMPVDETLSYEEVISPFVRTHWLADYLQWGYDGKSPWGIKDPRLCVLLPLYLKIFPGAKVIHIKRDVNDVAASLTRRYKAGVGVLKDFDHWKALTEAYTTRVYNFKDQISEYFELSYEDFCTEPEIETKKLFAEINLTFSDSTRKLLTKVSPARIGSYQQWLTEQNKPWWKKVINSITKA